MTDNGHGQMSNEEHWATIISFFRGSEAAKVYYAWKMGQQREAGIANSLAGESPVRASDREGEALG